MTTDRALLELAAKAGGIKVGYNSNIQEFYHDDVNSNSCGEVWNPLTDDGDRYRLAKTLKLVVDFDAGTVLYFTGRDWKYIDDLNISLERRILRAAAEIGRNMK